MKKFLMSFAVLLAGTLSFTACGGDEDGIDPYEKPTPTPDPTPDTNNKVVAEDVCNGVFIVGSGNMKSGVSGNVSYLDFATGNTTVNMFEKTNGRKLGLTANDALVHGDKVYFFVTNENTIEVCDRKTLKSIQQIRTADLIGKEGAQPRHGFAYNGNVYVSFFGDGSAANGIVAAIDTVKFAVGQKYAVGPSPEGVGIVNDVLYVANSDYGNGKASISRIDLKSGADNQLKHEDITNPCTMTVIDGALYVLDYGTYTADWSKQMNAGVRKITTDGKVEKVIDATFMGSDGKKIYVVNNPWGGNGTTYGVYDAATGKKTDITYSVAPYSAAAISANPMTGDIYIASLNKSAEGDWADYVAPGYLNQYDANGKFVKKYDIGSGPVAIVFNVGKEYHEKK